MSTFSFLYPKINTNIKNKDTPTKMPLPKGLHFRGVLLFPYVRSEIGINRFLLLLYLCHHRMAEMSEKEQSGFELAQPSQI